MDYWHERGWGPLAARISYSQPGVDLDVVGAEVFIVVHAPDASATGPGSADQAPRDLAPQKWEWSNGGPDPTLLELASCGLTETSMARALLEHVHRCLVLNATHEVGEWLKVQGRQAFGPHRGLWDDGPQGNGCVVVDLSYDAAAPDAVASVPSAASSISATRGLGNALVERLVDLIPSRHLTYRDGTEIALSSHGPTIVDTTTRDAYTGTFSVAQLRGHWSMATLEALGRSPSELREQALRDVHRMVVTHEVHEIGEYLRFDGDLAFDPHLTRDQVRAGAAPTGADLCGPVRLRLRYDG